MVVAVEHASSGIGGFWRWWLGELQAMLPARAQRPAGGRNAVILLYDRRQIEAQARRGDRLKELGLVRLPEPKGDGSAPMTTSQAAELKALQRAVNAARLPVCLRLPSTLGLVCTDVLPAGATSDLARIMGHKIDILTPWTAEQVYFDQRISRVRPDGQVEVGLVVAPRTAVDEVRRRLAALGLTADAVDVAEDDPWAKPTVNIVGGARAEPRRGWAGFVLWLLLVAGSVGAAAAGHHIYKRNDAVEARRELALALEQRLVDLPQLRESIDTMRLQAGFVAEQRRATPSPLVVLEVLSRLLPDSVWLSDLGLKGQDLAIMGYAQDPPALLALIEGSEHFSEAEFRAPSTRETFTMPEGWPREVNRFSLAARVEPRRDPTP
ncbi:MAG TPA: PilN domain-containing protein [Geminicoccaceae bacterium]|nr:PilN domain-containing protein [Geminicoccaceae bacterium]